MPRTVFTGADARFHDYAARRLPKKIQELLPAISSVRFLDGPLRQHVFGGTLNEIRPMLIEETERSSKPSLLLSRDGSLFALAVPTTEPVAPCTKSQKTLKIYWSDMVAHAPNESLKPKMMTETQCESR
jgi:hypothetical protein